MATLAVTGSVVAQGRASAQIISYLATGTLLDSMLSGYVVSRADCTGTIEFLNKYSVTGSVVAEATIAASFAFTGSAVVAGDVDAEAIIAATFGKGVVVLGDVDARAIVSGGVVIGYASPSTVALDAIVLNAETLSRSHYANFAFDSLISYKGNIYGTMGGVLYQLTGTTDAGTAIATTVRTAQSDFGVTERKNIPDVYVNAESAGAFTVKSVTDNGTESSACPIATVSGVTGIAPRRGKLPLGRQSRMWGVEVANAFGAASEIESIEMIPAGGSRRI